MFQQPLPMVRCYRPLREPQPGEPKLMDILYGAARAYGLMPTELINANRERRVVEARWLYYALARELGYSLPQIARPVKHCHSSVLHGLRSIDRTDRAWRVQRALAVAHIRRLFPETTLEEFR